MMIDNQYRVAIMSQVKLLANRHLTWSDRMAICEGIYETTVKYKHMRKEELRNSVQSPSSGGSPDANSPTGEKE
tara:strand:+ start:517 stop:738 length:222 start_codon:yes stop_codon:yes gene_type:complete